MRVTYYFCVTPCIYKKKNKDLTRKIEEFYPIACETSFSQSPFLMLTLGLSLGCDVCISCHLSSFLQYFWGFSSHPALVVLQCNTQKTCFSHSSSLWSDRPCLCCVQWCVPALCFEGQVSSQSCSVPASSIERQWLQLPALTFHPSSPTCFLLNLFLWLPAIIKWQAWKEEE